jgi:tRNA uracil 4-sulfurtransferase
LIQKVILARIGEIALKGLNRSKFEARLIANLKRRLNREGSFKIYQNQSRIWIVPLDNTIEIQSAVNKVLKVFGIVSVSIAWKIEKSVQNLYDATLDYVREELKNSELITFKIDARRSDKFFPMTSSDICRELGFLILNQFEELKVNVHKPDLTVYVEVRDQIYIYSEKSKGFRGLPVGIAGKGLLLLSGGIDSPVAGFMMASRGLELEAIYFHSYPYTGNETRDKVCELARIIKEFTGRITLHVVDFTPVQILLRENCPEDMLTILIRRAMMRIAQKVALEIGAKALITGESLGQVASQTLESIHCTDCVVSMPVFRPLIGTDKEDTVAIARKIGSFDTSILPYEDCCTLFVAKHPKTKPTIEHAQNCENKVNIEADIEKAYKTREVIKI